MILRREVMAAYMVELWYNLSVIYECFVVKVNESECVRLGSCHVMCY